MPNRKYLLLFMIGILLVLYGFASGKTLFRDDFEGDVLGEVPQNFDRYEGDGPHNRDDFTLEVVDDPEGKSGKVVHTFSTGLLLPKAAGRDDWTDWIWQWDWNWSALGYGGTVFRFIDGDYYHMSPRNNNVDVGFWIWQGAWQQIGDLTQYDFELDVWHQFQLTASGDTFTLKIKKRDDPTPFADIEPLLEMTDSTLKKGPMGTYGWNKGDAWMDNFIVGETEADMALPVEPTGRLSITWGSIKEQ